MYVGPSGKLLRTLIRKVQNSASVGVALSNVVKCHTIESVPRHRIREVCKEYLWFEISKIRPQVIVTLGNTTLQMLFPKSGPLNSERGMVHWLDTPDGGRVAVVPTMQPAAALHEGKHDYVSLIIQDLWKAFQIAERGAMEEVPGSVESDAVLLETVDEVIDYVSFLLHDLDEEDTVAYDVETDVGAYEALSTDLDPDVRLHTMQFASDWDTGYVVPWEHPESPLGPDDRDALRPLFRKLFRSKRGFGHWAAHHAITELAHTFKEFGVWIRKPIIDTMYMAYLVNEGRSKMRGSLTLMTVAQEMAEYHHYTDYEKKILRTTVADHSLLDPDEDTDVVRYGAKDAVVSRRLVDIIPAFYVDNEEHLMRLVKRLYGPLHLLLATMHVHGFWIDPDRLRTLINPKTSLIITKMKQIRKDLNKSDNVRAARSILADKASGNLHTLFGKKARTPFDLDKPDHVKALAFDVLELEPLKIGKSGKPSADKAFLEEYAHVPEIAMIQEYRGLEKLRSSYLTGIANFLEYSPDGRVHSNFSGTRTVTARLASERPNLQQVPRADNEEKKAIKNIFSSAPGNVLIQIDGATWEVRWLAICAQDPGLSKFFHKAKTLRDEYRRNPSPELAERLKLEGDVHRATAAMFYGVPAAKVTKVQRNAAKGITFGYIYGRSPQSIANEIGMSLGATKELLEKYGQMFGNAVRWLHRMERFVTRNGYVRSPFGRVRNLPFVWINDRAIKGDALRRARNSPIQGAASDAMCTAGFLIAEHILDNKLPWLIPDDVHDSVVLDVPVGDMIEAVHACEHVFSVKMPEYLEEHFEINVCAPMECDVEISPHGWGELEAWDGTEAQLTDMYRRFKKTTRARLAS